MEKRAALPIFGAGIIVGVAIMTLAGSSEPTALAQAAQEPRGPSPVDESFHVSRQIRPDDQAQTPIHQSHSHGDEGRERRRAPGRAGYGGET